MLYFLALFLSLPMIPMFEGSGCVIIIVGKGKEILVGKQQGVLAPLEEIAYPLDPLGRDQSQRGVGVSVLENKQGDQSLNFKYDSTVMLAKVWLRQVNFEAAFLKRKLSVKYDVFFIENLYQIHANGCVQVLTLFNHKTIVIDNQKSLPTGHWSDWDQCRVFLN